MFTISNTVVTTLQGFFEAISKDGIGKVPNRDVHVVMEQIVAVVEQLAKISALPTECTVQILEGFTRCSVLTFKETFHHLLVGEHLQQLHTLSPLHDSRQNQEAVQGGKQYMFNALNILKDRSDACFNCGDPDHGVPKPIDQARIDKAKADFCRKRGVQGGGGGCFNGGHGQSRGHGDGNKSNTRSK